MKQEDKYSETMLLKRVIKRIHQRMKCLLEACDFENRNLKQGQLGILFTLKSNPGISQRELAREIGVTPPSITVAIRKMEAAGLIIRKPDKVDQRMIRLEIQKKGEEILAEAMKCEEQLEQEMFQNFTQEERMLFRRLLMQIGDNLDQKDELGEAKQDRNWRC